MSSVQTDRLAFVTRVRDVMEAAGVQFAFLHSLTRESQRDSDLDVVVARESLIALDTVVRSGALGRLVQRLDYDVPWCRYYVVDTGDEVRRFRQLDVACDPFGISRYGEALQQALDARESKEGYPVVRPTEKLIYLVAKRAQKGLRDDDDVRQLRSAFAEAAAPAESLASAYGEAGSSLARALEGVDEVEPHLRSVGVVIRRRRNSPARLWLRGTFSASRGIRRVRQPTGLSVVLAGPDGTGKSTLAAALATGSVGVFRRVVRLHVTPGVLPPPGRLLRGATNDTTVPHARPASGRIGSGARVVYLYVDSALGWLPRVSLPRLRSSLVLIERGWRDLEVDPARYRLGGGQRAVRLLSRLLPRPDLTLVLNASPQVIHERKPELPQGEIERQLAGWKGIAHNDSARFDEVDTSAGPSDTLDHALDRVTDRLAARAGSLDAFETALTCLGLPRAGGTRYAVVAAGGRPRWILPQRAAAPGPTGTRLYRPAGFRHRTGAGVLELSSRLGRGGQWELALDPALGLGPELETLLRLKNVELGALLPTDRLRTGRTVVSVLHRGHPVAVAKVAPQGSPEIEREARVLAALERCEMKVLNPPSLLGSFAWRGVDVIVMSALEVSGRTSRPLGSTEESGLMELSSLRDRVASEVGGEGAVLVHGDFCGWNTAARRSRLAAWDWEWARLGAPLEDWFHWQTQRLVHFGRRPLDGLVRESLEPSQGLRSLCARLSVDVSAAPVSLESSLEHGLGRLAGSDGPAVDLRREALFLLRGRAR